MSRDTLELLHSDDPAQRRQAILNLLAARDSQAQPQLAQISQSDPEPALRTLAAQALNALDQAQDPVPPPAALPPAEPSPAPAWMTHDSAPADGSLAVQQPQPVINAWIDVTVVFAFIALAYYLFFEAMLSNDLHLPSYLYALGVRTEGSANVAVAMLIAIVQTIMLLLMTAMIHAIAWRVHRGNGTMALLIRRSVPVYLLFLVITMVNDYFAIANPPHYFSRNDVPLVVMLVVLLVRGLWLSYITARVHDLDAGQGCGTVFITNLLFVGGGCVISFFAS